MSRSRDRRRRADRRARQFTHALHHVATSAAAAAAVMRSTPRPMYHYTVHQDGRIEDHTR